MTAPADDDVPSGEELFARIIAIERKEGLDERRATLNAALSLVAWTIAQSHQAIVAEKFADLKPTMDQVHHELDRLVESAMRFDQAPRRGRP